MFIHSLLDGYLGGYWQHSTAGLCGCKLPFLLGKYQGVGLLDHIGMDHIGMVYLEETARLFSKVVTSNKHDDFLFKTITLALAWT